MVYKRRGAPAGPINQGMPAMTPGANPKIVDALTRFIIAPKSMGDVAVQYSDGSNARPSNPQNTQEKPVPDWPQSGALQYPSGHPLAKTSTNGISGEITDPSNQALQLTNFLFDEVTQASVREDKNSRGKRQNYRVLSDEGIEDHTIATTSTMSATGTGAAPGAQNSSKINPNCAISDDDLWTQVTAASCTFLNTSGSQMSGNADSWSPHGAILPVGFSKKDARGYIWQDGAAQAQGYGPVLASAAPSSSPVSAFATTHNSCSSFITIFAGTGGFAIGDTLTVTIYGYNEGDQYILCSLSVKFTGVIVADQAIFIIPTYYSDYYGYDASAVLADTGLGAITQRKIRIGHISFAGSWRHCMAPAINNSGTLSNWSATRLLASSLYAENWTSMYSLGAKAGFYQPEIGTHWQACGVDDRETTGGPYNFITSHFEEEDDTLKEGMYCFLQPGGLDRLQWRNNLQVASTLHGVATDHTIAVKFDLDDRNFCMQTLVSPGIQGNQAAQAVELQFNVGWEGKTEQQILFRSYPATDPEDWDAATKRTARMKHAYKGPDVDHFLATEGWRRRGRPRVV